MKATLLKNLEQLGKDLEKTIDEVQDEPELVELKASFLGKKGKLTDVLKGLGKLNKEDRPEVGVKANEVKTFIEGKIGSALKAIKQKTIDEQLAKDHFDVTLPGRPELLGHTHPIHQIFNSSTEIFERMGFVTHIGPQIEDDYHNFEALNIPENHPARDIQDTFYMQGGEWLLRTHTSTVQIHVMEKQQPPIRMIAPGTVYRCDSDVTHSPMFHQIEGLWVDTDITFADLKGVLTIFITELFGSKIKVRFRPSYFPFTEPSAELDISCIFCQGKGSNCSVCKGTRWIEILGCGMVNPEVFKFVNYDSEKYIGFAFGIGLERLAMLKFGINDLRLLYENDLRFLEQF